MFLVENNFVFLLKVIRLNNRVKKISTDSKKDRKKRGNIKWKKKSSSFYQSRHLTTKQREINIFFYQSFQKSRNSSMS